MTTCSNSPNNNWARKALFSASSKFLTPEILSTSLKKAHLTTSNQARIQFFLVRKRPILIWGVCTETWLLKRWVSRSLWAIWTQNQQITSQKERMTSILPFWTLLTTISTIFAAKTAFKLKKSLKIWQLSLEKMKNLFVALCFRPLKIRSLSKLFKWRLKTKSLLLHLTKTCLVPRQLTKFVPV